MIALLTLAATVSCRQRLMLVVCCWGQLAGRLSKGVEVVRFAYMYANHLPFGLAFMDDEWNMGENNSSTPLPRSRTSHRSRRGAFLTHTGVVFQWCVSFRSVHSSLYRVVRYRIYFSLLHHVLYYHILDRRVLEQGPDT